MGYPNINQGGRASYARVNDEDKVLLLAFGSDRGLSFGIFDTDNGKFLWGGHTSGPLKGNPVVKRNEVWSLEEENGVIRLVRHTPSDDPKEGKQETILQYRIPQYSAGEYSSSPDGSQIVVAVADTLLLIPVKEGVKEADVKVVKLSEK